MGTLRVSVVINNYNYGAYLREAIESALVQTYSNVEVIVVDDGSTDNSRDIIREYEVSKRVISVYKENGGQASALNRGFQISTGEIVLFLDADDLLEPYAAERIVDFWHPRLSKIHFPLRVVDAEGRAHNKLVPTRRLPSGNLLPILLRHHTYQSPPMSGNVWSRKMLQKVMPIPEREWRRNADRYLISLAPLFGEIGQIEEPLGKYRIHGSNASFAACGQKALKVLHHHLMCDVYAENALKEFAKELGLEIATTDELQILSVAHLHTRIASVVLEPKSHPIPLDKRITLAWWGMRASFSEPFLPYSKRVLHSLYFLAVGLLPPRLSRLLVCSRLMFKKLMLAHRESYDKTKRK